MGIIASLQLKIFPDLANNLEATKGWILWIWKAEFLYLFHLMWLLLPTGGLKSNWLVRKTSFIKEPATFSHETCEQCFINPEFFSSASCIQHTRKTASPSRVFTWTSVIFLFFFVGGLCPSWYRYALGAGFRSVSVINFPIFVCIPLLIDLRWNSSSSVSNSWLNTFPALKKTPSTGAW